MTDGNTNPTPAGTTANTALDASEQRHHRGSCLGLAVEAHKDAPTDADGIVATATKFAAFVLGDAA